MNYSYRDKTIYCNLNKGSVQVALCYDWSWGKRVYQQPAWYTHAVEYRHQIIIYAYILKTRIDMANLFRQTNSTEGDSDRTGKLSPHRLGGITLYC